MLNLAEDQAPKVQLGEDEASRAKCRDEWAKWWLSTEGVKLIDEIKKRTVTELDKDKTAKLIEKLGDDDFGVRERATKELKSMGSVVIPMLRIAASTSSDLEVRQRSNDCLKAIEGNPAVPLSPVVPRIIALRKPEGAIEALLNYMPSASDDIIAAEVQLAINALAFNDGKPNPLLLTSLEDKSPARRGAAGDALAQEHGEEYLPSIKKLLQDPDPAVRLKVALALSFVRQKEAVPVLIAALADAPTEQAIQAEEYLYRIAGDKAPANLPGGENERGKRRDAWLKWWKEQGDKVVLLDRSALSQITRFLNYTLLVSQQTNTVSELGADGKQRWAITGLVGPFDAQVLPGDRVLIAEYNGQRVTERNFKGDILWQKAVTNYPIQAQRLKNGNTFIVTRNQVFEVDRAGKEVYTIERPHDVMSAARLRDGQIVIVSNQGTVNWVDTAGKSIRSFATQGVSGYANEVLPNGHVIIPLSWQNRVTEYDKEGKQVWEKTVEQPMSAFRMPNGNTIMATQSWPAKVVELDKEGKKVNEITTDNYVFRAKKR